MDDGVIRPEVCFPHTHLPFWKTHSHTGGQRVWGGGVADEGDDEGGIGGTFYSYHDFLPLLNPSAQESLLSLEKRRKPKVKNGPPLKVGMLVAQNPRSF